MDGSEKGHYPPPRPRTAKSRLGHISFPLCSQVGADSCSLPLCKLVWSQGTPLSPVGLSHAPFPCTGGAGLGHAPSPAIGLGWGLAKPLSSTWLTWGGMPPTPFHISTCVHVVLVLGIQLGPLVRSGSQRDWTLLIQPCGQKRLSITIPSRMVFASFLRLAVYQMYLKYSEALMLVYSCMSTCTGCGAIFISLVPFWSYSVFCSQVFGLLPLCQMESCNCSTYIPRCRTLSHIEHSLIHGFISISGTCDFSLQDPVTVASTSLKLDFFFFLFRNKVIRIKRYFKTPQSLHAYLT